MDIISKFFFEEETHLYSKSCSTNKLADKLKKINENLLSKLTLSRRDEKSL